MKRSDFHFDLPDDLIAQEPLPNRSDSRLLYLSRESGRIADHEFGELPDFLNANDLLVFNDTRVIPARLYGSKETGGKVEILVERILGEYQAIAQVRSSKSPKPGSLLLLGDGAVMMVEGRQGDFFMLRSQNQPLTSLLEHQGHMPLPPYIERADNALDLDRYQTVYASRPGAVAAPTAGLHFDQNLMQQLDKLGVRLEMVTLHVGAGTFQPVREEKIENHHMHSEYLEVSSSVCDAVAETRDMGGRVIAVGTTSVRSLETAAASGELEPFSGDSRIFIYPGYDFRVVDGMITNFHLPESTLLMLISAFAGLNAIKAAYQHAIEARYRFFSYGDAMLIT